MKIYACTVRIPRGKQRDWPGRPVDEESEAASGSKGSPEAASGRGSRQRGSGERSR